MKGHPGYQATRLDYASQTWERLRADVEADLEEARGAIESPRMDHDQTQVWRGYIDALKGLLARADEALAPAMEDDPGQPASSLLAEDDSPRLFED